MYLLMWIHTTIIKFKPLLLVLHGITYIDIHTHAHTHARAHLHTITISFLYNFWLEIKRIENKLGTKVESKKHVLNIIIIRERVRLALSKYVSDSGTRQYFKLATAHPNLEWKYETKKTIISRSLLPLIWQKFDCFGTIYLLNLTQFDITLQIIS